MSIAIMACRKLIGKCAGSGCFKAYNNSDKAFSIYGDNKEELASFFYCIGCKETLIEGENWKHKISQLKKNNVKVVHISDCIKRECETYKKHEELLKKEGFEVIHGTH
ncbi:CGGC domain-containing protein [Clostridium sp. Ade.TY]|uniref:CGGC domain-containing protein n=1 Tax=Clostridium sp. Ade.TY TaxID=1391647 RepID=UPI00041A9E86|nr:CGGC domain-containing protein [Clostridium sp. Ade.TY]